MYIGKADRFCEGDRSGMFYVGFARETAYYVCRNTGIREKSAYQIDLFRIVRRGIMPVHPAQNGIAAALQGQMKVRTETGIAHGFQQRFGNDAAF